MRNLIYAVGLLLLILHQDFWNWTRTDLVMGFMPIGLAYHVGYTLVVVAFWIAAVRLAWPHEVERFGEQGDDEGGEGEASS